MNSRPIAWIAVLALLAPLAFLLALRLFTEDELAGVTFDRQAVVAGVTQREVRDRQQVGAILEWQVGAMLRAPAWSGMVTAVYVGPGEELTQGQPVLSIDGVDRVAFARPAPFYRFLESGDEGPDVALLHDLLLTTGFIDGLPDDPEFFSFATFLAVEDFNARLGIPASGVFDPAVVIWMPTAPFVVEVLDLSAGAPAPGPGTVIARGPAALTAARLEARSPTEPIALQPGVPYVLVKGDARIAFDPATLTLPAESLATLAGLVKPLAEQTDVAIERETPLQSLAVASTAIVANAAGGLCAWVVDAGSNPGFRPVAVTLAGSRAGVTDVVAGLSPEDQVLVNPADVLDDWQCP